PVLGVGGRDSLKIRGPRVGRVQRGDPARVGLETLDLRCVDVAQARHAVGPSPPPELLEPGQLRGVGGDDQLAAAIDGDAALLAVVIQLARALDAEPRLQRARRVVDAGMDDARVVSGLVRADLALALQYAHRGAWVATDQLARDRQANDPATDDREIAAGGRRDRVRAARHGGVATRRRRLVRRAWLRLPRRPAPLRRGVRRRPRQACALLRAGARLSAPGWDDARARGWR